MDDTPGASEIRVAQAQLVGWLEGLIHGIQAALMLQQVEARRLPGGMAPRGLPGATAGDEGASERPGGPGQYL